MPSPLTIPQNHPPQILDDLTVTRNEPEQLLNIIEQLSELAYVEEDEDSTPATQYAQGNALRLIVSTYARLGSDLPAARLTTTETGGINCYWRSPNDTIQLTVGSSPAMRSYIYIRENEQSAMQDDVSPANLTKCLKEFIRRSQ